MTAKKRRAASAGTAFLLTFATVALVWQGGRRTGLEEAVRPTPAATPTPAPNAFTDPVTTGRGESELARKFASLVARRGKMQTKEEAQREALALYELARTAHFQSKGDGRLSLAAYQEALRLFRRLGDQNMEGSVLVDLAETQSLLGQIRDANGSLRAALALRDAGIGLPSQRADTLYRLGTFLQMRGQYENARPILDRALRLQQRLGNEPGQADCLAVLGQAACEENSLALSRQLLGEAARLFEQNGKIESHAAVLGQLGDVALQEGEVSEARQLYRKGLRVWQERKQNFWTGRFLVRLAKVALKENDIAGAKRLATKGQYLLSVSNGPVAQARALLILGEIAGIEGKTLEARRCLQTAEAVYRETENASGLRECQDALVRLSHSTGSQSPGF